MKHICLSLVTVCICLIAQTIKAQGLDTVRISGYIVKETYPEKGVKKKKGRLKSVYYPIDIMYTYRFLVCKDAKCQFDLAFDSFETEQINSIFAFCPLLRPTFFFKGVLGIKPPSEFRCEIPKLENDCEFIIKDKLAQVFFVDGLWIKTRYNSNLNVIQSPFDSRYTNFKGIVDLFYLIEVIQFNECVRNDKIK